MQQEEIQKKVYGIIARQFALKEEDIRAEWSLQDDLGADSAALIELMINLEDVFDREVPDITDRQIQTVGDAVALIRELTPEPAVEA